jgi:hypothetical protein
MKKIIICILVAGLVMGYAACKKNKDTKSSACEIVTFTVDGVRWQINGTNISNQFAKNVTPGMLTPTIVVSDGATVVPASGTAQNFFVTNGVSYTVTAEDGATTKKYVVKATNSL